MSKKEKLNHEFIDPRLHLWRILNIYEPPLLGHRGKANAELSAKLISPDRDQTDGKQMIKRGAEPITGLHQGPGPMIGSKENMDKGVNDNHFIQATFISNLKVFLFHASHVALLRNLAG